MLMQGYKITKTCNTLKCLICFVSFESKTKIYNSETTLYKNTNKQKEPLIVLMIAAKDKKLSRLNKSY